MGPTDEPVLAYLLDWWGELALSRAGGFGISAITYQEIAVWAGLTRRDPLPREIEMLRRIDACFINVMSAKD